MGQGGGDGERMEVLEVECRAGARSDVSVGGTQCLAVLFPVALFNARGQLQRQRRRQRRPMESPSHRGAAR